MIEKKNDDEAKNHIFAIKLRSKPVVTVVDILTNK